VVNQQERRGNATGGMSGAIEVSVVSVVDIVNIVSAFRFQQGEGTPDDQSIHSVRNGIQEHQSHLSSSLHPLDARGWVRP